MKAHFKYLTLISWTLLTISCSAQKLCTPTIELKEKYKDLGIEEYKSNYEIYHNDYEFTALNLLSNNTDEYDLFYANLMVDLIKNKDSKNNYLFTQKYFKYQFNDFKNKPIKIPFRDNHINYFQYVPLTADSLAGKLLETYQKYNDVFIGTHTWYKYDNGKMEIKKQIDYDAIYPICWSKAIKIAKKKGVKQKFPKLQAPQNYPEKQEKQNAFWTVSDTNTTIKVDAYTGDIFNK